MNQYNNLLNDINHAPQVCSKPMVRQWYAAVLRYMRDNLTTKQYNIFYLSTVKGLSGKEIHYEMGISERNVSICLNKAKAILREALADV